MEKKATKIILLILATAYLISILLFDMTGTTLSLMISAIPAVIILVLFFIYRNIYWWTIPMDIMAIVMFCIATYMLVKHDNMDAFIAILLSAFLIYFFTNYIFHISKYRWFKENDRLS